MICVGYSKRASCIDDVTKVGLKEQSDRIRKFASENKLKLSRFYEERSDDPNSDTGFNELRKDGLNRKFDLVIFESMLRFGAGILIAKNLLLNTFFLMEIHFIVIEDDLDSRNETYESLDKYFIDKYRSAKGQQLYLKMDKTTRNFFMKERFGYSFDPNGMGMIVDDEAADVIRMIYSMALNGMTKKKIADYLTENNYETPQTHLHNVSASMRKQGQGIWRTSTVCRILSDERYIGHTDKNGIEYPTIITEEEFQKVKLLEKRKPYNRDVNPVAFTIARKCIYEDPSKTLVQVKYMEGREWVRYLTYKGRKYPIVEMNAVISAIRVALRKEHYLSQSVLRMVGSFDAQQYLNEMEERYRARAKVLFDKSVEIQKDNIPFFLRYEDGDIKEEAYMAYREMMLQDLEEVSDKFTALNKEVMKKRKLFATDNPWIKRYKDLEVKGELTEDLIKKYVMSIHVSKDGELTVYLNISGREVFPKSWIERKGGIYAT